MTVARRTLVSLENTPFYHCIARCVRRAFLCGDDAYSGQNFDHRRQWLVDRLKQLASIFAIDICAYAIMSNHYHVVLHVHSQRVAAWSDDEVMRRWCQLFRGPSLVQLYLAGEPLGDAQMETLADIAAIWRQRLGSISWFMRCLNESIARRANAEDDCKGRFWEGRFRSQALLDAAAVLSCMAYVDLNPVRAGIAADLEHSDFTSIQERLAAAAEVKPTGSCSPTLLPFAKSDTEDRTDVLLPFTLEGYIDLVDWTGRAVRGNKHSALTRAAPSALQATGLNARQWLALSLDIQRASLKAIGSMDTVRQYTQSQGLQWLSGQRQLARIYYEK
jgi:REP element-mobilizing transposase RayT